MMLLSVRAIALILVLATVSWAQTTTAHPKGAVRVGSGAAKNVVLPPGTNGQVLTADSAAPSGVKWAAPTGGVALPPSGAIFFITSGTCPAGTTEAADLVGKTIIGTVAASGDVGATGGADSVTPAGTNSAPTFTGSAATSEGKSGGTPSGTLTWPAGVPTFAGTSSTTVVNHTHGFTNLRGATTGTQTTGFGVTTASDTSSTVATLLTAPPTAGGVASYTPAGTIAWPAGVPTFVGAALATHTHQVTALGMVSAPAFTGAAFDNRSAYVRVIFCRVN